MERLIRSEDSRRTRVRERLPQAGRVPVQAQRERQGSTHRGPPGSALRERGCRTAGLGEPSPAPRGSVSRGCRPNPEMARRAPPLPASPSKRVRHTPTGRGPGPSRPRSPPCRCRGESCRTPWPGVLRCSLTAPYRLPAVHLEVPSPGLWWPSRVGEPSNPLSPLASTIGSEAG